MALAIVALSATSQDMNNINTITSLAPVQNLELSGGWDKVFPLSPSVEHSKVTFVNRYGITLAANLYKP